MIAAGHLPICSPDLLPCTRRRNAQRPASGLKCQRTGNFNLFLLLPVIPLLVAIAARIRPRNLVIPMRPCRLKCTLCSGDKPWRKGRERSPRRRFVRTALQFSLPAQQVLRSLPATPTVQLSIKNSESGTASSPITCSTCVKNGAPVSAPLGEPRGRSRSTLPSLRERRILELPERIHSGYIGRKRDLFYRQTPGEFGIVCAGQEARTTAGLETGATL